MQSTVSPRIDKSDRVTARTVSLPAAVSGDLRSLQTGAGRLCVYTAQPPQDTDAADREGPLLLIHSVNAAGSAYEVRPLYEHYRTSRAVYAPDLPGFGFSDRSDRNYTPRLMTDAVHATVEEIRRIHGAAPIDALALSLSCEFLARAAVEAPEAFRSIALVSPTGFDRRSPSNGPRMGNRGIPLLHRFFTFPLWSEGLFDLLTTRSTIRFFLRKTWGSKAIDEGMLDYDCLTTRQPGARHAPYAFISGFLFSNGVRDLYESIEIPVWMAHGERGDFVDYRHKNAVEGQANWTFRVFPTGALPHFEMLEAFTREYDAFLARARNEPPS
jgi:pimeloyl-ACP methyl ester carboxylesterase